METKIRICKICEKDINVFNKTKGTNKLIDSDEGSWFYMGSLGRIWFCNKCLKQIKELK